MSILRDGKALLERRRERQVAGAGVVALPLGARPLAQGLAGHRVEERLVAAARGQEADDRVVLRPRQDFPDERDGGAIVVQSVACDLAVAVAELGSQEAEFGALGSARRRLDGRGEGREGHRDFSSDWIGPS